MPDLIRYPPPGPVTERCASLMRMTIQELQTKCQGLNYFSGYSSVSLVLNAELDTTRRLDHFHCKLAKHSLSLSSESSLLLGSRFLFMVFSISGTKAVKKQIRVSAKGQLTNISPHCKRGKQIGLNAANSICSLSSIRSAWTSTSQKACTFSNEVG